MHVSLDAQTVERIMRTIWMASGLSVSIVVLMRLMALLTIKCEFMILNGRFAAVIRQRRFLC